jgi:hypothetical protein
MTTHRRRSQPAARGLSLLEMILALTIFTIISIAVSGLIFATIKSSTFLQTQSAAVSQVDFSLSRIVYNIRTAAAAPAWSTVNTFPTLSITKSGVGTITYHVDAGGNLVESDPRYNVGATPNILIQKLSASGFSCSITPPSATQTNTLVLINLVMNAAQPVERHMTVASRGF